jgi:molybdopterin synthase sulfur carrier subunit
MLIINYYASIREALGQAQETLELPSSAVTVTDLRNWLVDRHGAKGLALADSDKVLVAVNQTIVGGDYPLQGDEEIAFFPPMTGG